MKTFAKSKSAYFVLVIFLVAILTGCTKTNTISTNATTAGVALGHIADRVELGSLQILELAVKSEWESLESTVNVKFAKSIMEVSGIQKNRQYYVFKNLPAGTEIRKVIVYDHQVILDFTNKQKDLSQGYNATDFTKNTVTLQWDYEDAESMLAGWVKMVPMEKSAKEGVYTSKYEYVDPLGEKVFFYAAAWIQDGRFFYAQIPESYGLENILKMCDVTAISIA